MNYDFNDGIALSDAVIFFQNYKEYLEDEN